jgi:hypothetical protein
MQNDLVTFGPDEATFHCRRVGLIRGVTIVSQLTPP